MVYRVWYTQHWTYDHKEKSEKHLATNFIFKSEEDAQTVVEAFQKAFPSKEGINNLWYEFYVKRF